MRRIALSTMLIALLAGCGGTIEGNYPSQSIAVPCSESAECVASVARGDEKRVCSESFIGNPAIMMSTWDNGTTWLKGNCDHTNG